MEVMSLLIKSEYRRKEISSTVVCLNQNSVGINSLTEVSGQSLFLQPLSLPLLVFAESLFFLTIITLLLIKIKTNYFTVIRSRSQLQTIGVVWLVA
ncbi:unnamed protein product [Clavelina lepadiformis]|uniref:Uncharacterized protein n=1 Tax=Clavelina lepadiformis TaxID=159417 RepID=A0ABP0H035_CLALP